MHTARHKMQSVGKNEGLSPVYSSLPSTDTGHTMGTSIHANPVLTKSPVIARAAREAGSTLYEILGMTELMRVAYEKGEMQSMQFRLDILMSEAANLSTTLTNILELSKLQTEPATTPCHCFDIAAMLQEVSRTARMNIGQKPISIMDVHSNDPVMILSDSEKVRRIIMGLMSNAVKFTDRGRIALILDKDDYRVRITITDTGRGMTAEQMNAAFAQPDIRELANQNDRAGSGPGLRTIRNLVKLLEGSITVSSKFGEGTIVDVSLPIEPSENLTGSCRETGKGQPCAYDGPR